MISSKLDKLYREWFSIQSSLVENRRRLIEEDADYSWLPFHKRQKRNYNEKLKFGILQRILSLAKKETEISKEIINLEMLEMI